MTTFVGSEGRIVVAKKDDSVPQNVDAERSILGAIILDNSCSSRAFTVLKGDEFFHETHKTIYRTMQSMSGEGTAIDLVTLTAELDKRDLLNRAGGGPYLASLVDGMPRVTNVEHYAKIVNEAYKARLVLHFCDDIKKKITEHESADFVVEQGVQKLLDISAAGVGGPLVRPWNEVTKVAYRQVENERDFPEKAARFFTGLEDLDNATGGFRRGELVLIVGPTSNGKSLVAGQLVDMVDRHGYFADFFSAEMPGEQLVMRQMAFEAKVDFWKTRSPVKLTDEEMLNLKDAAKNQRNIMIIEKDITPGNIRSISEIHKRSRGLDLTVVDYDQLVVEMGIDPDEDERKFFRHQRAYNLGSKKMAKDLDVCYVMLSQLRKISSNVAKGGRPTLDDIYGDSSIRNTPDVIIWIVRDFFAHGMKKEFEDKATAWIMKARNGRVCRIPLKFDSQRLRLLDKPPSEEDSVEERETKKKRQEKEDEQALPF